MKVKSVAIKGRPTQVVGRPGSNTKSCHMIAESYVSIVGAGAIESSLTR